MINQSWSSNIDMAAPLEDMALERQNSQHSVRFMAPRSDEWAKEDPPTRKKKKIFSKSRQTVHCLVVTVKILMLLLVLVTLVVSKVSIATILAHLRNLSSEFLADKAVPSTVVKAQHKTAAGLYWQLLFILMVPNIITWVRALINGVIGKSSSQPWPTLWAILGVSDSNEL